MDSERLQRAHQIFDQAMNLDSISRARYVEDACLGDPELRNEVDLLIISQLNTLGALRVESEPLRSDQIGRYKILRRIGQGGMGNVYLAQSSGEQVAIKIIKRGMDNDEILRKFKQEQKILAALDHPNIACLIEADTTDTGLPYFVMEYVPGKRIDEYCDNQKLNATERLDLFRTVCSAVEYAHQKQVIHRDLKPPNILVSSGGVPKLLDFGIAKLLNPEQTVSGLTATSIHAMTPDYASPEQVRGERVTFSSDIYSLGIILYELLTGKRPYRVNYLQPLQIMRAVCETEPEKPSAMVSQSAQVNPNGDFAPKVLQQRLKGDLDNIVLMALRKEAAARYPSAEAFSDDIGRHLTGHPVRARRAMRQFRIKKIIRNRFTLFAAAVLILAIAASVLSFRVFPRSMNPISNQQSRIRSIAVLPFEPISSNQRDEYLEQGIADALITRLSGLRQIIVRPTSAVQQYSHTVQDPLALGKKLKVDAVLSGNVQQSENQLRVMARVTRTSDGQILWSEQYDSQISAIFALQDLICAEVARALTPLSGKEKEHLKKRETESVEAYQSYLKGRYFWSQRNPEGYAQALKYFTQATQQDPHFALAYVGLANANQFLADFQLPRIETMRKVKAYLLKALEIDPTLPEAHVSLALFKENYEWDWPGALKEYRQVLALRPNFSQAHHWYGEFLVEMGRFDEGIRELKRALEIDPLSLIINTDLAKCLYFERQYDEALTQLNKTLQIDPQYFMAHVWLGSLYCSQKKYKQAIAVLEQLEPSDHQSLGTFGLAAYAYGLSGNQIEAKKILAMLTEESKHRHVSITGFVNLYIGLGKKDQAFFVLEQEYSERSSDLLGLKTIPLWDPLRSDPRYDDLMRRVGFLKPLPN